MLPTIYKVKTIGSGILSIMARPISGGWIEEEFAGLKHLGIDIMAFLLERKEQVEVGLELEEKLCLRHMIEYVSFPIPDRGVPNTTAANIFIDKLHNEIIIRKACCRALSSRNWPYGYNRRSNID